jgi:shikimate 5-dehydrogenase
MIMPTAATRLFAVLGDPVSQSLSPVFQNAAFDHLGLDAVYMALRCSGRRRRKARRK